MVGRYICGACGPEQTAFTGQQEYTETGTQTVYMDSSGDIEDWGDRESNDSDAGDISDVNCSECGGRAVWDDDYHDSPTVEPTLKNRMGGII